MPNRPDVPGIYTIENIIYEEAYNPNNTMTCVWDCLEYINKGNPHYRNWWQSHYSGEAIPMYSTQDITAVVQRLGVNLTIVDKTTGINTLYYWYHNR